MPKERAEDSPAVPGDVLALLHARGIEAQDEIALRHALEERVPGYSLYRLTPAAVKRWKCRYRIMLDAGYYDGQTPAEAYARALLAVIGEG